MSLFKGKELKQLNKNLGIFERRLDAADTDRRSIKDNADKFGGLLTDLDCKVKSLKEGKCNAKKHKH